MPRMSMRFFHSTRQLVVILFALTMVFVSVVPSADAYPANQQFNNPVGEVFQFDAVVDPGNHVHREELGGYGRTDHHVGHGSDCHTGLCCVMDCQHVADKQGSPAELIASAGKFSIIDHGSRYRMVPDRPPRHS